MNYLKIKALFFSAAMLAVTLIATAQDKDAAAVKEMLETKNFVFKAQFVSPTGGRMRNLTSEYDLTVRPDTVIAFLPYFGRAYSAPINGTDGGIKFTASDFDYQSVKKNKNKWEIKIKPRNVSDSYQLYLTVFETGRASLQVNSMNRQAISFTGFVTEGSPLNKKAF